MNKISLHIHTILELVYTVAGALASDHTWVGEIRKSQESSSAIADLVEDPATDESGFAVATDATLSLIADQFGPGTYHCDVMADGELVEHFDLEIIG